MFIYIYIHTYIYTYIYTYVYIYIHNYIYVHTCTCMPYMHICTYVYVYIHIHVYTDISVLSTCIYARIFHWDKGLGLDPKVPGTAKTLALCLGPKSTHL